MLEKHGFPVKNNVINKAGITIRLDQLNDREITLYLKKPDDNTHNLISDESFKTIGKLIFQFVGGSIELFAENVRNITLDSEKQEDEI